MNLKVWSKTLLNVYGCLNKLSDEIDKIVLNYALSTGGNLGVSKTYKNAQKIIELTQRKITLINIKVLIDNCLEQMEKSSSNLLKLKFINKLSVEMIAENLNIKKRTYYRKYQQAISSFSNFLLVNGYDAKNLIELTKDEAWMMEVFTAIMKKEIKASEAELSNGNICSMAVTNYKKQKNLKDDNISLSF